MRNPPNTVRVSATLVCNRASVTVYVIRRADPVFPYAVHSWDREYNDGEGQYVYENGYAKLEDAVAEASRIFAAQVRDAL